MDRREVAALYRGLCRRYSVPYPRWQWFDGPARWYGKKHKFDGFYEVALEIIYLDRDCSRATARHEFAHYLLIRYGNREKAQEDMAEAFAGV